MRGRRKGRKKYVWFPNWCTQYTVDEEEFQNPALEASLAVASDGAPVVGVLPMLRDPPTELLNTDDRNAYTLADSVGSEYFVRRIVGKIDVQHEAGTISGGGGVITQAYAPVFCKFGIFVASADTQNPDVPRDFTGEAQTSYNPAEFRALREPWMFQRTWILGGHPLLQQTTYSQPSNAALIPDYIGMRAYPVANWLYGSLHEGRHIDVKTARRVRQEERLWACFHCQTWPFGRDYVPTAYFQNVRFTFDYRVLGALRKAVQRGAF